MRHPLLLGTMICSLGWVGATVANDVSVSLDLVFNTPNDLSSGGTWTAVARSDASGLAGIDLRVANVEFDAGTGFLAPDSFEIQLAPDLGTHFNIIAGDDLTDPVLDVGVIGMWTTNYPGDSGFIPLDSNDDLGTFAGGVAIAMGSFEATLLPEWFADGAIVTDADVFTSMSEAINAANVLTTVRFAYAPVPGDGNLDGKVDGLDYLIWADSFGDDPAQDPPGSPENGDNNDDGKVDGLDYLIWANNFGTGPNAAVAVPETTSALALELGVVLVTVRSGVWRRRQGMAV